MSAQALWQKGTQILPEISAFTVGSDPVFDLHLAKYDVLTNMAHLHVIEAMGWLSGVERRDLHNALVLIYQDIDRGAFSIHASQEDIHTAIENRVTDQLGLVGKKLHTARSRNDQVLTDLRLYQKHHLLIVLNELSNVIQALIAFQDRYGKLPIPGYTHMQKAMPSSLSQWCFGFVEALLHTSDFLDFALSLCDRNPLGTGSGYGFSVPLRSDLSTKLLGFSQTYDNPIGAHHSRSKVESIVISALSSLAQDLGRFASDLILFSTHAYGYFTLPPEICTGSSLMPQKLNPDVLELVRGHASHLHGQAQMVSLLGHNLTSGYQRDYQLLKKPLIEAFLTTHGMLHILPVVLQHLRPQAERLQAAMTPELFATDRVLDLVGSGVAFREAYQMTSREWSDQSLDTWPTKREAIATGADPLSRRATQLLQTSARRVSDLEAHWDALIKSI